MRWTGRIRFLFLAPAVIWVLAFTVFPLVYSLSLAFFKVEQRVQITRVKEPVTDEAGNAVLDSRGQPRTRNVVLRDQVSLWEYVGAQNFARLFKDPQVREAVRVTLVFVLFTVPIQVVLGFLLALLFNQRIVGRNALRATMILPIFATPLAMGYVFFTIFYEVGGPLAWTGIPWLSSQGWALFSVAIVDIWQHTPFCFLVFLAALQGVPDELLEAARIDGAAGFTLLRQIIVPLMIPTVAIIVLIRVAEALKVFDIPFALTGGGPGVATQPYSMLAFRTGLRFFDVGYASAMSYGMLVVVMVVITLFFRRLRDSYG